MRGQRARGPPPRLSDSARPSPGSRWISLRRFFARDVAYVRVTATEPQQRVDLRWVHLVRFDLRGEEDVIPALARVADDAPQDRHASGDRRGAARIGRRLLRLDLERRELVRPLRRLPGSLSDVLLRRVKERDAERAASLDELAG